MHHQGLPANRSQQAGLLDTVHLHVRRHCPTLTRGDAMREKKRCLMCGTSILTDQKSLCGASVLEVGLRCCVTPGMQASRVLSTASAEERSQFALKACK